MAIISILTLIGAGSLIAARDQYTVDNITEEMVSAIRDAQNRSISVSGGHNGWGVWIENQNKIVLGRLSGAAVVEDSSKDILSGATITSSVTDAVFFMAPFGTPHLTSGTCDGAWGISQKPTKEYAPSTGCTTGSEIKYTIKHKGIESVVTVNKVGDIRID